jgi:uncharacterized damage-inducible protein DinB
VLLVPRRLAHEPILKSHSIVGVRELLRDLLGHQEWADALHWTALLAHPGALQDAKLRERLHHIHLVQRAFLEIARGGGPPAHPRPEDYASLDEMRAEARRTHEAARRFVEEASDAALAARANVPWFKDPPLDISVAQALHQCAMHSQYHRGQNATRLKELGGAPPLCDLIIWWWQGRPQPLWP